MAQKLASMGFTSMMADPDVWLRAATKPDGELYYEYVLMYVDDILAMSCDTRSILEEVQGTFKFKNGKIDAPEFYLGAKLQKKVINGFKCWSITSQDYIKAAVKNVEEAVKYSLYVEWKCFIFYVKCSRHYICIALYYTSFRSFDYLPFTQCPSTANELQRQLFTLQ
jgi:hypothetical protein